MRLGVKPSPITPAPLCPWCGLEMFVAYDGRQMAFGNCQYVCSCGAAAPVVCVEYAKPEDWDGIEEKAYKAAMLRQIDGNINDGRHAFNTSLQKPLDVAEVLGRDKGFWLEVGNALYCAQWAHSVGYLDYLDIKVVEFDNPIREAVSKYGVFWRCWANKPTDEERTVAKWERE